MIPSIRLATTAGDQGVPAFEASQREWELQSVTAPPRTPSVTTQQVAKLAEVETLEVQGVGGDEP